MDSHHHQGDFFLPFWAEERQPAASPEFTDSIFFPQQVDLNAMSQTGDGGITRGTLRLSPELCSNPLRGPLLSPTGPSGGPNFGNIPSYLMKPSHHHPHHPMIMSYSTGNAPTLMPMSKASSSSSSPVPSYGYPPSHAEDAPSTDATPESSDVEDEAGGRSRRKKRAKKMISDDLSAEHNEHARMFPLLLDSLRKRLLNESSDGVIHETAAVSALINEFIKGSVAAKYSLPMECEQWLKRAAEDVNEARMASKGSRKKKMIDFISNEAGERTFVCTYCAEQNEQKNYKTQEGLNLHVRNKHVKDKGWVCYAPGCNVSFVRQADLRMHLIRMHAPVRPYPCGVPFCLKSFAGVSELRRHVKVDHYKQVRDLCGNMAQGQSRHESEHA